MITLKRFRRIEAAVRTAGFGDSIEWTESIVAPVDADAFATEAIYVVCNSGMRNSVAVRIFNRCMSALHADQTTKSAFGHAGKTSAIDAIWNERHALFEAFQLSNDKLDYCGTLPFIGAITKYHLAKNYGLDFAKPDVHLERLARRENITSHQLCARLSRQSGYRIATIDTILWRACAEGIVDSALYEMRGWRAAFTQR